MHQRKILWLLLLFLLIGQPVWSGCCRRSCGQSQSQPPNHGKLVQRSYRSVLAGQRATIVQTQAIEQYMKLGCQLEAQKKWADAEQSFHYVLQVVSRRDGPGSIKSVPALEHLVTVSKAQKKLDQAIGYQKTALLLTKAQSAPNQQAVLNDQISLGDLLIQKKDYVGAEPILKESVAMYNAQPPLPRQKRRVTYLSYAKVLRQLHKNSDADAIEAAANADSAQPAVEKSSPSQQIMGAEKADNQSLTAQTTPR